MKIPLLLAAILLTPTLAQAAAKHRAVRAARPAPAARSALAALAAPAVASAGVTLKDLRKLAITEGKPLAVIVIKGFWCPACATQLKALTAVSKRIRAAGGKVVGLSTDDAATNQMFAKKLGLGFQVLGAPDEKVFEQLGLWMPAMGHPLPGVAFIDPCGGKDRVLRGRRPGRDQTDLIVRTLKKMSADATRCRTRT